MELLSVIFFTFLNVVAFIACIRCGKVLIKALNRLFDEIENKFC